MQLGEHECADVKLRYEFPGADQLRQLCRCNEFHRNAWLGRKIIDAFARFHEEGMHPVAQAAGARKRLRQRMHRAG
jgi:hypothetical protein